MVYVYGLVTSNREGWEGLKNGSKGSFTPTIRAGQKQF